MRILIGAATLSLLAGTALAQQSQQTPNEPQYSQQQPMQQGGMQQRRMQQGGMQQGMNPQQQDTTAQQQGTAVQQQQGMNPQRQGMNPQAQRGQTTGVGVSPHQTDRPLISPQAAQVPMVNLNELYQGWRGSTLIDQEVYGPNGQEIGEVHDIILGRDGRIVAIIVEAGGFLDIGDSHVRVPWNQVNLTGFRGGIQIPYTEDQLDSAGLFNDSEYVFVGPREFRLSELRGDYVRLLYGPGFGQVRDVVFNRNGQATAVLVARDVTFGGGVYAYPYYGYDYGWRPGWAYYAIPFERVDLATARAPGVALNRFNEPWNR